MGAIRGTTPDYELTIDGVDLTDKTVIVTIEQGSLELNLTNENLDISYDGQSSSILFSLSQTTTLQLYEGQALIQVKFIDANGKVSGTDICSIRIDRALYERVMVYAEGD